MHPLRPMLRRQAYGVFVALLVFRLVNALSVQTYFQPDEYFQSLEPAWQMAFGLDSGAWITWEWREHLRSSLHPMMFAGVYRGATQVCNVLQVTVGTRAAILLAAPKVLQAVIAASGDFFTWALACKLFGHRHNASYAALALTAFSPWQFHCSVRTFLNSLETVLTIAALYYWPWQWFLDEDRQGVQPHAKALQSQDDRSTDTTVRLPRSVPDQGSNTVDQSTTPDTALVVVSSPDGLYISLSLAAVACILRPTNIVIWATITLCLFGRSRAFQKMTTLASSAVLCGTGVLTVSLAVDRAYYGQWVFPPLQFLYFNLVQGIAGFYGLNRLDYYFTEGLPLLLTTALPFAGIGMWHALRLGEDRKHPDGYVERQTLYLLAVAVIVTVLTMTTISHKEVRFIYPLLPILDIIAARPLAAFFHSVPANKSRLLLLVLMLAVNIYIAAYVTFVHQRGVVDVMHFLRHEQEARLPSSPNYSADSVKHGSNVTVGFLMPCHSTPWRSHLVYPDIKAWALTCEPPLDLSVEECSRYEDEADIFYNDPRSWAVDNMESRDSIMKANPGALELRQGDHARRAWPEYLVFFEQLEPVMSGVLERTVYDECWRGFNTHWHDDGRRQGDVVVWCMR
ncbi:glycosylphosphatidylinositol anchor biosynthesis [Friedmanniomyces endolithicus]|uniref:Mannosyltransferase n=1 Tax=Friedmanniomyces endolithicus TaxID=329885 RepID=A0AAN6R116_9PEZI|nr:glycosylphosphatidylinositol anchor biosynthesis [Friedmanniomyces endolithicus]KAK0275004.1 glycosylphosphatidylinositol anchor biosynthesis [Friedmanniomyces endolithicus]KAK0324080.1 glycosylphosphatidylinositol anchor biosynthesis [Friedmanniomyces endolithicus]KAK0926657.1 glycosylphosphatidylinositol anchor biosynthesis [Friedmanniomyces endolithicus]KAK0981645.1 glycosylphosphatidylinositol anchor biosynthesis [Friedmanniomyces endolithicus]